MVLRLDSHSFEKLVRFNHLFALFLRCGSRVTRASSFRLSFKAMEFAMDFSHNLE
jgi:hypothetical protein